VGLLNVSSIKIKKTDVFTEICFKLLDVPIPGLALLQLSRDFRIVSDDSPKPLVRLPYQLRDGVDEHGIGLG
jgi:hypothetical protein